MALSRDRFLGVPRLDPDLVLLRRLTKLSRLLERPRDLLPNDLLLLEPLDPENERLRFPESLLDRPDFDLDLGVASR